MRATTALLAATSVGGEESVTTMVQSLKTRLQQVASGSSSRRQLSATSCENKIYAYNQCTGITDEANQVAYGDDAYGYEDPSAECAYLLNGGTCAELVDDGDASCTQRFYESVECYYSAVCGRPVRCGGEDPFESERKPVTFYNAYPMDADERVCFFYGDFLEKAVGPLAYGEAATVDVTAEDTLFVGYSGPTAADANCDEGVPVQNSHALGVYVSDVNTYGVGVLEDGSLGPKAWRSEIASDPDSTIFVHEARGYEECRFDLTSADLGFAVEADDGVAQDLTCADYQAAGGHVSAVCDGERVDLVVDTSSLCARAAQQFMAVGDKHRPDTFPLQLLLVQANERCDYRCADSHTFDDTEHLLVDVDVTEEGGSDDSKSPSLEKSHHSDTVSDDDLLVADEDLLRSDAYANQPARSILTVSAVSLVVGLCLGCACMLLALPFWRRSRAFDDEVEQNKALHQPLLEAAI